MSVDSKQARKTARFARRADRANIAFQRFGLGAKSGVFDAVSRDAEAALLEELDTAGIAEIRRPDLPTYERAAYDAQKDVSLADVTRRKEIAARIDKHLEARVGFVERLVIFWSNHFSMSVRKANAVRGTIGQFERDIIRRHVLGRFSDMLVGAMQHPAMIAYLDNDDSIGPNSPFGIEKGRGINENFAREILETHTLGSGGGYSEQDVTNLSLIFSGWSYVRKREANRKQHGGNDRNRGQFIFRPEWHQPGPIPVMGRTYSQPGIEQGEAALEWLARHPSTAEHIAYKLVRHFITDKPTPELVEPVAREFRRTRGNLLKVSRTLVTLPGAFDGPLTKIRTPYELAIAQFRAIGQRYEDDDHKTLFASLKAMNNMVWEHPTPEGYPDDSRDWLEPDGMLMRLNTADYVSRMYDDKISRDIPKLATDLFGDKLSPGTRERVEAAGNARMALALLFCSPEFQRR